MQYGQPWLACISELNHEQLCGCMIATLVLTMFIVNKRPMDDDDDRSQDHDSEQTATKKFWMPSEDSDSWKNTAATESERNEAERPEDDSRMTAQQRQQLSEAKRAKLREIEVNCLPS